MYTYGKLRKVIGIGLTIILIMIVPVNIVYGNIIQEEEQQAGDEQTHQLALNLHARSAMLMDADSGRVLYSKDGNVPMAMASTTKIMTCIIALEQGKWEDIVTVSANASMQPKVKLYMAENERYYLGDLLYSLMLESHNDTATAIAEHIGGSVEGFAELMNYKAKELGCTQTNFVTPNGLDAPEHKTTAEELGMIARYAIANDTFNGITNTPSHTFSTLAGDRTHTVTNLDQFLYQMDGAFGVKTGFTGEAGYCFVGALKQGDRILISVVLGSGWPPDRTWKWEDTEKLMRYGLDNFTYRELFTQMRELDTIRVEDGQLEQVAIFYETPSQQLLLRNDETVVIEYVLPDILQAPVSEQQEIGKVICKVNGENYMEVPIYTRGRVAKIDLPFCFQKVVEKFLP
jgi:D-alanyl-D-alanine carboxypeptidase